MLSRQENLHSTYTMSPICLKNTKTNFAKHWTKKKLDKVVRELTFSTGMEQAVEEDGSVASPTRRLGVVADSASPPCVLALNTTTEAMSETARQHSFLP